MYEELDNSHKKINIEKQILSIINEKKDKDKLTEAVIKMNQARGQPKKLQTDLNNWGA